MIGGFSRAIYGPYDYLTHYSLGLNDHIPGQTRMGAFWNHNFCKSCQVPNCIFECWYNCNVPTSPTNVSIQIRSCKPKKKNSFYIHDVFLFIQFEWNKRAWWRHQIETFSALLALCKGNSPATGEYPSQRLVTQSFDVFFDLHLNQHINSWANNWDAGDLRRHRAHYDVIIMDWRRWMILRSCISATPWITNHSGILDMKYIFVVITAILFIQSHCQFFPKDLRAERSYYVHTKRWYT